MFRYFVKQKASDQFIIIGSDVHHIKNVVKLKIDEQIECVYANDVYLTKIIDLSFDHKVIVKEVKLLKTNKKTVKKVLIAGILREQKWDYLLQKSAELGVDEIVPVVFKRNVVKIDKHKYENKISRWQTICDTAAKQTKRNTIPVINNIVDNLNDLEKYKSDLNLVAWEEEKQTKLIDHLSQKFSSISFIIGCEGGIDANEIKTLNSLGFANISLGENILRAETAPLYILSSLILLEK